MRRFRPAGCDSFLGMLFGKFKCIGLDVHGANASLLQFFALVHFKIFLALKINKEKSFTRWIYRFLSRYWCFDGCCCRLDLFMYSGYTPVAPALIPSQILLNHFLLSRIWQDTSHKLYRWHGSLAYNLILVSKLAVSYFFSAYVHVGLWKWAQEMSETVCVELHVAAARSWLMGLDCESLYQGFDSSEFYLNSDFVCVCLVKNRRLFSLDVEKLCSLNNPLAQRAVPGGAPHGTLSK